MVVTYETPNEYYFRIHHIRPRFKNDIENVLIYIATELSKLNRTDKRQFDVLFETAIRYYPGNATKTDKTIKNWRTEISSLFGLIEYYSENNECSPSAMALLLARNQDLVEFFKYFLYYFQYPGFHIKTRHITELIKAGIRFKPTKYILELLSTGENETGGRFGISKEELTHCVFNDLRVTRDHRNPNEVISLIQNNRQKNARYNCRGDVIRYAGDILDYMVIADLLVKHGHFYYLNPTAIEIIVAFRESDIYFSGLDSYYGKNSFIPADLTVHYDSWFHYVNDTIDEEIFRTDIFDYLGLDREEYTKLESITEEEIQKWAETDFFSRIESGDEVKTKEIGDVGENLAHGHECMRVKKGGREDLIHLIHKIPTQFAVGYDIKSINLDETFRHIEVKSTISKGRLTFNSFHLTKNEFRAADTYRNSYYVYRLMITKESRKLFIIKDPIGVYKSDTGALEIRISEGADVTFNNNAGTEEELLIWGN